MSHKKIVLLDGSSLAFRAFFSILDLERFKNKDGLHTNALFSFNRMLENILDQFQPTHILVAFDQPGPTFRTKQFEEYKGNRQKTPSEFKEQLPYFRVLLDGYGIQYYDMADYEADDIIGTLSRQADSDDEVIVISGDKDLTQLATDNVTVYITRKGVSELEAYTPEVIREKFDLEPLQIIEMKGLMGDSSDNYPGITRIGEKTALKLLHQFNTVAEMYDRLDELKPSKMKENIINDKANALMSRDLAEIITNVPLEKNLEDIAYKGKQTDLLMDFYRQMQFNSFLTQLQAQTGLEAEAKEVPADLPLYPVIEVDQVQADHLPDRAALYIEMLEENYHMGQVIGLVWQDLDSHEIYLADWDQAIQSPAFKAWLADASNQKILFDSKRDQVILANAGLDLAGIDFDIMIANYLIDTHLAKELADMLTNNDMPSLVKYDEAVYGKGAKQAVPDSAELNDHLANKVKAMGLLVEPLTQQLKDLHMWDLYQTIEMPLARVLARMEIQGVKVDAQILADKNQALLERLAQMEAEIYDLAGEEFNINSVKQLGVILFEKLELPIIKKTKTGYSTAADVLEKLADKHPIIPAILEYRQISKLQGTYLAGLPTYIKEDGKIHSRFVQTLTQTGRLSSADPNLQNIPARIEEGRRIRQAFVPAHEGWQLFGADYSQIELRVLAHIAQDQHMIAAFKSGEDIHEATARRVFGLDPDTVIDANLRRQAKAVNFGIVYGISDYGLSNNLNIPRKHAKAFIENYFEKYPDIHQFMEDIVAEAKEKGYVETLFKRRRYLPDIDASNFNIRSFAERTAMNSPIQGTAADIIKIAMVRIQDALDEKGLHSRLLLSVHDEVILEGPAEEMEVLSDLVPDIMESCVELDVPLKVEYNQANDWYELK